MCQPVLKLDKVAGVGVLVGSAGEIVEIPETAEGELLRDKCIGWY
jgi:hypothetical protein